MSGTTTGGGVPGFPPPGPHAIIVMPHATGKPPVVAQSDVQAWCDSLDDANPLKAILTAYLATASAS